MFDSHYSTLFQNLKTKVKENQTYYTNQLCDLINVHNGGVQMLQQLDTKYSGLPHMPSLEPFSSMKDECGPTTPGVISLAADPGVSASGEADAQTHKNLLYPSSTSSSPHL